MRTIYELTLMLRKFTYNITVLTTFPRQYKVPDDIDTNIYKTKKFYLIENHNGLQIFRIKTFLAPYENFLLRGLDSFISIFTLLLGGLLQSKKFDVILCGGDMELVACIPAYLLKKIRRIPCALILDDIFPMNLVDSGVLKNKFLIKFFEILEKLLYRNVDKIIVHSRGNKKLVVNHGASHNKVHVVPLWADVDFINRLLEIDINSVSTPFKDKFIVSFAGVISYAQDLDTVLEAAKILKPYKNIIFLIVGEGPNKRRLLKKASTLSLENVFFYSMQTKDKYIQLLKDSSVSLVPLKKEYAQPVIPSKLIEIMAVGCPVIISAPISGDAPKLVKEAECGIVVKPGNAKELADAILFLYNNPAIRKRFGDNGKKYVNRNHTLASCAKKYEKILIAISKHSRKK